MEDNNMNGNGDPLQAVLAKLASIEDRLSKLEAGSARMAEQEDEEENEEPMAERKKKEKVKKVRIYREVSQADASEENPVVTPKLGENPVGNVPGEGKYVGKEQYDDDMGKMNSRVERLEKFAEGAGLQRDNAEAGDEQPEDMMKSEKLRESLSRRKTIVGGQPSKSGMVDVKSAVKEFLGGVA